MIRTYNLELDEDRHPQLVLERTYDYYVSESKVNTAEKIVQMMNTCFRLDHKAEEYVYAIAVDTALHPLDIFEISHGAVNYTLFNPRELLIRLLLAGCTAVIAVHNHPGCTKGEIPHPSEEDQMITSKLSEVCQTVGIWLLDHVIIGENSYYSFKEADDCSILFRS